MLLPWSIPEPTPLRRYGSQRETEPQPSASTTSSQPASMIGHHKAKVVQLNGFYDLQKGKCLMFRVAMVHPYSRAMAAICVSRRSNCFHQSPVSLGDFDLASNLMALCGPTRAQPEGLFPAREGDTLSPVTMTNPFPGMNPFFEQQWRDAHTSLITYLRDALQSRLPADLMARTEEEVVTVGAGEDPTTYRPDAQIREPWALKEPGGTALAAPPSARPTEPIRVFLDEEIERWIEIHDQTGRLITVLELLSASNKLESAERDRYRRKRRTFISGGVNLVEIDLVRQGTPIFLEGIRKVLHRAGACYGVCVFRAARPVESEVSYPPSRPLAGHPCSVAPGRSGHGRGAPALD